MNGYTDGVHHCAAHLPRHAFSPRDRARAGDIWRAFQEAAVCASTDAGWPPRRYREAGTAFVVRSMSVVHHQEAHYGDGARTRTWVRRMRRGMLSTREIRLVREDGEPLASARQEWVHVGEGGKPARAGDALLDAFPVVESDTVDLPDFERSETPKALPPFEFEVWHTAMDPLAHVNHPAYVDLFDEAIARALRDGLNPQEIVPLAEELTFFRGLVAGERARVESECIARTDDAFVIQQRVLTGDALCARAILVRRELGGTEMFA